LEYLEINDIGFCLVYPFKEANIPLGVHVP